MTVWSSAKTETCAVRDPTSQHERAYNSGAFDNVEEKLEGLKIIIKFVLQSLKKDDSSSPKDIGDFYKEFGLKLKKGRSASSAITEKDLVNELKTKCSSRDRGGKKLRWKDVLDAAIGVLKLLSEFPFAAAVPSIFLVAALRRAETGSENKMEAAEVISELENFVDFLLGLASRLKGKWDLKMLSLMNKCVNVVDEGFWLCTSILIEGKLKGLLGATSNKESIEKLKQRCERFENRLNRWLMIALIPQSDADLRIREEPSGAKIEKNSFKSEASIKTMELFSSTDTKVYDTTLIQAVNPQMKISASVHEDEEAAEASMKTMVVFSSKDAKVCDITSSQAANPQVKKSASTSSVQEDEEPNPQMMKFASVHEDEEPAQASMKIMEASSSEDMRVYDTTSSQAANPQLNKSGSVDKEAPSADFYEICYGTLQTTVQASSDYFFYGKQQW